MNTHTSEDRNKKDSYILGIDTGGTYTDSVIIRKRDNALMSKSKALTTKENLVVGLNESLNGLDFEHTGLISSVSLSTTLATNAIVEKRNCKVCLILIGKSPGGVIPADSIYIVQGRHDLHGNILYKIDQDEIAGIAMSEKDRADAFAVSGYLSVRNPAHELEARNILTSLTDLPVFCAHELSGELGFYERTVTAVLNASLTAIIRDFIYSVKRVLKKHNIKAPIMLVKGDGSLMNESIALERPAETVLSGPAASIIGASILTKEQNAMIYDLGGTTSDIAFLENGKVYINPSGAMVDCWQTHIRAANIYTYGLGGDSYLRPDSSGNKLLIGPERVVPLSVSADIYPGINEALDKMKKSGIYSLPLYYPTDKDPTSIRLSVQDRKLLEAVTRPCTETEIRCFADCESLNDSLGYLVTKGLLVKTALTPTDIRHVQGDYCRWDIHAAREGSSIVAAEMGMGIDEFVNICEEQICKSIVRLCHETIEYYYKDEKPEDTPVIGIGAPAASWLSLAADRLVKRLVIPDNSDVANAIGAALCPIREVAKAIIRYHKERDIYSLFLPDRRMTFNTLEEAEDYAEKHIGLYAEEKARAAGSSCCTVTISTDRQLIRNDYIQTRISALAYDSRGVRYWY